jgi:DNA mismatch endonuclease (patch repair protein)
MDVLTPEQRRRCMAKIGGRNTKPEIVLRKALFAAGFRYRLHQRELPGTPDLVFPKYRATVFVHGCFWHGHGCALFVAPETNREFWLKKIAGNRARDERAVAALGESGWRVMTVWECGLRGRNRLPVEKLAARIAKWLKARTRVGELP